MVKEINLSDSELTRDQLIDLEVIDHDNGVDVDQLLKDLDVVDQVKQKNKMVKVKGKDGEVVEKEYVSAAEASRRRLAASYAARLAKTGSGKITRSPPKAGKKRPEGYHHVARKPGENRRKKFTG